MKRLKTVLLFVVSMLTASAQQWFADTLGGDFQCRYFDQGTDYSGNIRSCLTRLLPKEPTNFAVLYIHGFNDYFFQAEMAERFINNGYAFFATDLRKYGRSLMDRQKHCQVRNFNEYFADLDSALTEINREGYKHIIMIGHSTGGLVAAYYMAHHPDTNINGLILNSPFLDWNLGKMECVVGIAAALGRIAPNIPISSGSGTAYGESLSRKYHGEWDFNTQWKSVTPLKVDLGWVRAVNSAQKYLKKHKYGINVPILLMYSSKSIVADDWSPDVDRADAVLDVDDIRKYGLMLGHDVTSIRVTGGRHDLILSEKEVREPLYTYIFSWLKRKDLSPAN